PRYAYSLISEITGMAMSPCRTSTLYAMLERLEKAGYVKSHEETAGKRTRRIYRTTPAGWKLFLDIKKTRFKGLLQEFMKALVS
ncbi:MAG: PadR family transcriptional regulator, partial [Candidatus Micrarchaeota archaeon]|nr:PadR family transcriptional regulator [Candidatus Micrarchaeota archaeon]